MSIDAIAASRLRIPLVRPYRLAFGAVTHYDTLVVEIVLDDGRSGYGEATLLTGYTDETIEGAWDLAADLVETLCGLSAGDGRLRLNALAPRAPFLASAFSCALDHAGGHPLLRTDDARRVPLLGLLQGDDDSSLRDEFARLLAGGYKTVKVKVGFDARADAHHVAAVQRIVDGRAAIRIDANQGYAPEDAVRFIDSVDPVGIELFEQPCAAGDWDAHAVASDAARRRKLPLMLDESIYGIADIERAAAEHACRFIKLKLMKFAGIDALTAALERIRGLGMQPVLGNGVACDLSCWMEACVASRYVDNAGEMNGFLKVHETLFGAPLPFDNGHVVLPAGYAPQIDRQALAARACGHVRRHRKVHACAR
ncbi:MAG TPA: enolase C-terminal domain-like protein [Casimicrobiaceae bacterium]|nr:enolase C-terminal domain-like protein [Casimicrobiaceae bacterium]